MSGPIWSRKWHFLKRPMPVRVLLKPAKLDDDEWNIMRTHCYIGYKITGDHPSELLKTAAVAAFTHHENGTTAATLSD